MKFGLILNTQFVAGEDAPLKVRDLVDQVRAARDAGFDSVAGSHHYLLTPFQMVQPLPLLGRLAAEAGSMRLITNIFLLTIHTPVYVAEQVASLDVLTEGRFVFGVGLGYRPEEFEGIGVEMKTRVSRFLEILAVARRLWTEDIFTLVRDRFIVGTPDDCRAEIRRYRDLLGVNYFLLRPQWPGVPQKRVLDQIELIGHELIPSLRSA
jgi:alkanesulfonate monooxygenase SsuD/methylene tetrahydromethanopterin reductase-like flavin-dependent oxidoreductase (luciferase family)